ncbi:hypothetical protein QT513_18925, partial [Metapseudomonas otitidis]
FVSTEAAHSTAAFLSVKLFFEEFFFLLNNLRFVRFLFRSEARILQHLFLPSSCFFEIFFSTQQLSSLCRAFRFSEARILHE